MTALASREQVEDDAFDYMLKLREYDAQMASLRHLLAAATKDLQAAIEQFYAARTALEKAKLTRQTIRDEMRSVDGDRMSAQSALKAIPR